MRSSYYKFFVVQEISNAPPLDLKEGPWGVHRETAIIYMCSWISNKLNNLSKAVGKRTARNAGPSSTDEVISLVHDEVSDFSY